jgi:hypothetical protein
LRHVDVTFRLAKGQYVFASADRKICISRRDLEGSVQHGGARMRVNVQLIDAESGIISGPGGSTSRWSISSTCRTKSSRAWRMR